MREVTDALRSVKKYVAEILAPQPPLAQIVFGLNKWTHHGQVAGAQDVTRTAWNWLLAQDRYGLPPLGQNRPHATLYGDPSTPASHYWSVELASDPAVPAAMAGILLDGYNVVAAHAVLNQPQWEVRLWFDRGEIPPDRPYARVQLVGGQGTSGPASYYELTQPMSVECYPQPFVDPQDSMLKAARVMQVLLDGFKGAGVGDGRPLRIPLYDYAGRGTEDEAGDRHPSDFLRVQDFSARLLPDPQDPARIAVMSDLRVSWRRDVDPTVLRDRNGKPSRGSRRVARVNLDFQGG